MVRFILRRLLYMTPILFGVSVVIFLILHLVPGDPARLVAGLDATQEDVKIIRSSLGLDRPLPVQYISWLGNVLRGDLGRSTRTRRPVTQELRLTFPATVELTLCATLLGVCTPSFWLGLMLMLVFAVKFDLFPTTGRGGLENLVLPAVTLGAGAAAIIARVTRSSMLEVLGMDYIRTAHAKGLSERAVVLRHAVKNALIPVITVIGLEFGYLLAGAVVTETVFAYPGVGWLLVEAIGFRDYPVIQGALLLLAMQFALVNLVVDVLYAFADPRISYG
ncbi:MAG: ABC-type dipeptide/oligopeptide/nickel transport system, permease component [candidate division NC10 bacterium]|nr:ABC-type dipeptide/oligopeptide/nickel transport system, permease component [candidate division NC10 bacterium]